MTLRKLKEVSRAYEVLTGYDPVNFKGCMGNTKEKEAALWRDVNWYRTHTESISSQISRLLSN